MSTLLSLLTLGLKEGGPVEYLIGGGRADTGKKIADRQDPRIQDVDFFKSLKKGDKKPSKWLDHKGVPDYPLAQFLADKWKETGDDKYLDRLQSMLLMHCSASLGVIMVMALIVMNKMS